MRARDGARLLILLMLLTQGALSRFRLGAALPAFRGATLLK